MRLLYSVPWLTIVDSKSIVPVNAAGWPKITLPVKVIGPAIVISWPAVSIVKG